MSDSIKAELDSVHPRMLRAGSESDPQRLGKHAIGQAIDAALERSRMTKQEAAYAMGYADSGVMGRWINGTETPQFAKLWTLGTRFRQELVIALAESVDDIEAVTELRIRRRASA